MASKSDSKGSRSATGKGGDIELIRARFDRLLDTTTAASAAKQILRAVEKNHRRVLVGHDAKFLDLAVRALGAAYQPVATWIAKKQMRFQ